ncbi:MAG: Gfo/Idh/MocA family oxidoreductase, partial [Acidobacteria bacterium]|nr:Gfo/Idh/MocA family oxidoreductase [Acidobacteriota bacterium]
MNPERLCLELKDIFDENLLMKTTALLLCLAALPLTAQEHKLAKLAQEHKLAQEFKIAFIGLRYGVVWAHLPRILQGQGGPVKLVGIAETEPDLIAEARRLGATDVPVYADYQKMLDEVKPDIVWGFVENNRHLEVIQACAPRKIHVMYQKPLASTYQDALAIRALARKHGIQVLANYDIAFYPTTYAAKAKADSGDIGKIWRMHGIEGHGGIKKPNGIKRFFSRWLTDPVQNGAGALMDFGCYNALWALWYKGRPENVYASSNHLRPAEYPKVEDTAVMVLSYKDGVGIFEGSWDLPRAFQQLEVFGRTGSLRTAVDEEVAMCKGNEPEVKIDVPALAPEMAGPTQYLGYCLE